MNYLEFLSILQCLYINGQHTAKLDTTPDLPTVHDTRSPFFNLTSYNPEQRIITKDLLEHIDNEMKKLTDRQRTIYELNRNDDFTYSEIAEKLGLSPKTIQYHIGTVLSRFKKILS